jgi:hypothetical protein
MAIVNTGNDLEGPIMQSGWTVVSDGFGLSTSVTVFKGDTTSDVDAFLIKGTAHPDEAYSYLKLDKWRISWDALNICTITVDYVGIEPGLGEEPATMTKPNISSANGLTSEPITSHPAFFNNPSGSGYAGDIAGPGPYTQSSTGPMVMSKTTPSKPERSYMGINGACFESQFGGRFIGFVDPTFPSLYGKTNYLATTTSYSGIIYSSTLSNVQALLGLLNTATSTDSWGVFQLLPAWAPTGTVSGVGHVNLLSQVNVQEFGSLYKINYEIRYSKTGWDAFVYVNLEPPS